jgi:hypothetical protein
MVHTELESYPQTTASEPLLSNPDEVQRAIKGLKPGKDPGPDGILNRALKHLPKRAVLLLLHIFNVIILTQHFLSVWKHARVISILKLEKDPAQLSSYWPISLLDTIGKLFKKILLTKLLHQVDERGLMRDELFWFRPGHSTSLQLARLVERITRNLRKRVVVISHTALPVKGPQRGDRGSKTVSCDRNHYIYLGLGLRRQFTWAGCP